ncbi:MAG: glycosyltransferase family 4 protein [Candidatus Doudnabacteria bacterium]|nr:glycosyltransferase family 4 protein [Candidatus Doudnabacteria bacterium]
MKICVVAYKFGTEQEIGEHLGTYHYFIEKMRRLARLGNEVYVIAPWLSYFKKGSTEVDGVKILRYYPPFQNRPKLRVLNNLLRWWYIKATQMQVSKLDKQTSLDIIYVWQARETGYAVAQIVDKLRAPFVFRQITAWEWHFQKGMPDRAAQMKFAKVIYDTAKKVVFVSRAASEEGRRAGLSEEKIAIIGVGIETDFFQPRDVKIEWDVSFIGRINFAEKGIGYLLEAMPEIVKIIPSAKLGIIGGGGETPRMREFIKDLGIEKNVELLGQQPFSKLPAYLNSSKILVVPSAWVEHFGQVTVEGMASGIPVVNTNIGGSPEINTDGQTGLIVPPKDSHALAAAIIKLLTDDELRQRMGRAARERVLQNYTYDVLVNKFLELVINV